MLALNWNTTLLRITQKTFPQIVQCMLAVETLLHSVTLRPVPLYGILLICITLLVHRGLNIKVCVITPLS